MGENDLIWKYVQTVTLFSELLVTWSQKATIELKMPVDCKLVGIISLSGLHCNVGSFNKKCLSISSINSNSPFFAKSFFLHAVPRGRLP